MPGNSDRWARGAFAMFAPGSRPAQADIVSPEGKIDFAGEHCSLYHAWIEGALESGVRAARAIHEARPSDDRRVRTRSASLSGSGERRHKGSMEGAIPGRIRLERSTHETLPREARELRLGRGLQASCTGR